MNIFRKPLFEKKYRLLSENIDNCSEDIFGCLKDIVDSETAIKVRLMLETKLLLYLEKLSADTVFCIRLYEYFGQYFVRLELPGDRHDCSTEQEGEYFVRLAAALDEGSLAGAYAYENSTNVFTLKLPQKPVSSTVYIVLAIVLAIFTGFAFSFLPPEFGVVISKELFTPLFQTIMGLLGMASSFMVFFSVLAGVCSVGDIDSFNKQGKLIISRFLGNTLLGTLFATVVCFLLLPIVDDTGEVSFRVLSDVFHGVLFMIPVNAVTPFIESNALQILFLALGLGIVILINGDKTKNLVGAIESLNLVVMSCVKYICRLMPLIVYLSISQIALSGNLEKALFAWNIIVLLSVVVLAQCAAYTLYHAAVLKKPLRELVEANLPIGIIGAATDSSPACLEKVVEVGRDFYGTAVKRSTFCYPLLQMFDKATVASRLVVFLYFMCASEGVKMPLASLVTVNVLMISLLAVSIAPIPSGDIPIMIVIVRAVGLPMETVALYSAISFILARISTGARTFTAASEIAVIDKKLREG